MKAMRKIVDSNFLQDQKLAQFLSSNPQNRAILIDYVAMEAYKGNTLKSIYKSMEILSQFPNQILVLKGTKLVCGLKTKGRGLQKRFIDKGQTRGFKEYCIDLDKAKNGNPILEKQLLKFGEAATSHMSRIKLDSGGVIQSIGELKETFSSEELTIFRKRHPFTRELSKKVISYILYLSEILFSNHPKVNELPNIKELPNSYIFRYSLCTYLLIINWISDGGANGVKNSRMRNDLVDMHYVTYSTFFDGLLTKDKKAKKIYNEASYLINHVFKK